jgi:hypothetical protein
LQASLTTRVTSWLSSQPFITCCILVTCVAIYVLGVLTGFDDFKNLCMSPFSLVELWEGKEGLLSAGAICQKLF